MKLNHQSISFLVFIVAFLISCSGKKDDEKSIKLVHSNLKNITVFDSTAKSIHVFVALCDNKYQGIVPVPASIGNGQDPNTNLYWGCDNGIKTYFKKSKEWKLLKVKKTKDVRLERLIFKHSSQKVYLIADAYDGQYIKQCTKDFLRSCAGQLKDTVHIDGKIVGISGNSKLISYIGHDGLMDFNLTNDFENSDQQKRDCIILACISKKYFAAPIQQAKANPLVWTTGLMCPEAYTLHDAINGYLAGEKPEEISNRAAIAYTKYQKCGLKAAKNLLVTGW